MKDTSLEAWQKIKDSKLLSERKWQVYDYVFRNGPCLMRDALVALQAKHKVPGNVFSTRFSELERAGFLKTVGKKMCADTGNEGYVYEVTGEIGTFVKATHTHTPRPVTWWVVYTEDLWGAKGQAFTSREQADEHQRKFGGTLQEARAR